jgi:hypothetical protein
MVERMVSHGQWITMSDDQVVRRLEEHGDTEAGVPQTALVALVVLCVFLEEDLTRDSLLLVFRWTLRH